MCRFLLQSSNFDLDNIVKTGTCGGIIQGFWEILSKKAFHHNQLFFKNPPITLHWWSRPDGWKAILSGYFSPVCKVPNLQVAAKHMCSA